MRAGSDSFSLLDDNGQNESTQADWVICGEKNETMKRSTFSGRR